MLLVERKGTIDGFEWRCRNCGRKRIPTFVCRSTHHSAYEIVDFTTFCSVNDVSPSLETTFLPSSVQISNAEIDKDQLVFSKISGDGIFISSNFEIFVC
ncbi:hypothetical protein TNCV_1892311 [Trichonephila clavipes]|nr:hypothetical protein TNCV_1892311 [Trichonephila clavipes]